MIDGTHLMVIPRLAVRIEQQGARPFIADPQTAVFYNRGQAYEAEQLVDGGEDSLYFSLDEQSIRDCADGRSTRDAQHPRGPLPFTHGPCDARAFAMQQQLAACLAGGELDHLAAEEIIVVLSSHLLRLAFAARGARGHEPKRRPPARAAILAAAEARRRDAVEHARILLLRRFREPLSLAELADGVGLSAFHLCRVFRHHVGQSLHQYRTELRLRAALGALCEPRVDLVMLALDLGFSSQSHFTSAFSRRFGCSPARFHRAVRRNQLPLPVTILKDQYSRV